MATELGQTDIEAEGRKLWQLFKLLSLGHGITSTLPWNMYVWPVKRLFQQTNLEQTSSFLGPNYRFQYKNWITFALTWNQCWVNMRNIGISYQNSDRNSDSDEIFKFRAWNPVNFALKYICIVCKKALPVKNLNKPWKEIYLSPNRHCGPVVKFGRTLQYIRIEATHSIRTVSSYFLLSNCTFIFLREFR